MKTTHEKKQANRLNAAIKAALPAKSIWMLVYGEEVPGAGIVSNVVYSPMADGDCTMLAADLASRVYRVNIDRVHAALKPLRESASDWAAGSMASPDN